MSVEYSWWPCCCIWSPSSLLGEWTSYHGNLKLSRLDGTQFRGEPCWNVLWWKVISPPRLSTVRSRRAAYPLHIFFLTPVPVWVRYRYRKYQSPLLQQQKHRHVHLHTYTHMNTYRFTVPIKSLDTCCVSKPLTGTVHVWTRTHIHKICTRTDTYANNPPHPQ